jgi:hypothetical protein
VGLKKLEQTLRATSPSGARDALLLLGNGVHLQAAREAGLDDPDPWLAAVQHLAKQSGIRDIGSLPSQEPLRWDALVRQASPALNLRSLQADAKLRTRLVQQLVLIQRRRSSLPFFGRIVDLHFENILSFNMIEPWRCIRMARGSYLKNLGTGIHGIQVLQARCCLPS